MNFSQLISDKTLTINGNPDNQQYKGSYKRFLDRRFKAYIKLIENLNNEKLSTEEISSNRNAILEKQIPFINGILKTVDCYLEGNPHQAYETLKNTIDQRRSTLHRFFSIGSYPTDSKFYRVRVNHSNNLYSAQQMFHIPFEKREYVTTQRFSIYGFPSLYLNTSIYGCWEELGRPDINVFDAVRINNTRPLHFVDLTPPFIESTELNRENYTYLMSWPLILACSIPVRNIKAIFKPEYIIPQLLLQWVRNSKNIDGIRYWSTHLNQSPLTFRGELHNIVIPVKTSKEKGLCNKLTSLFTSTQATSWQSKQILFSNANFMSSREYYESLNEKVEYIELIPGRKSQYGYSVFGELEKHLDGFDSSKIS
jgi:hypothetical protein